MAVPLYQAKAEFFRTLGHPARIRVLELLAEHERPVHDLLAKIEIAPSNLSQQLAVLRGVEVKVLIPDMKDHLLVWLAAFEFVGEALEAGVSVMRYRDGFMHQKVVLVDDRFASVGTINLDNRSCRLNFEVTAVVFDPGFAAEVEAMLAADFARAVPHAERAAELPQLARSVGAPVARLFAPIL